MTFASNPRPLAVLRLVRERQTITRSEISEATGLSASQVSRLTADLMDEGLLTVERRLAPIEGRPTELLALATDQHFVAGLDVGGVSQQASVSNLRGEVVASLGSNRQLSTDRDVIIDHLVDLVDAVLAKATVRRDQILGLGVGLRAVVDPISGVITGGPETPAWSPAWIDFAIRDELARVFPWERIVVDDTVRALGVAEGRYGGGAGESDFVYLLADTGIGAAIMISGRPYIGPGHIAGEIGHITLDPNGEPCGCGKVGCLETFASSSALLQKARAWPGGANLDLDAVIALAGSGDERSISLLSHGGAALGRGMAVMLNLLAPRLIVIGGVMTASEIYINAAIEIARAQAVGHIGQEFRVLKSGLGPLAGAAGAGTMILDTLFDPIVELTTRRRPRRLARTTTRSRGGED